MIFSPLIAPSISSVVGSSPHTAIAACSPSKGRYSDPTTNPLLSAIATKYGFSLLINSIESPFSKAEDWKSIVMFDPVLSSDVVKYGGKSQKSP